MKASEIRKLTDEEIKNKIKETKDEVFNLRFQQAAGELEKPSRIIQLRHDIARMKTILSERSQGK